MRRLGCFRLASILVFLGYQAHCQLASLRFSVPVQGAIVY